MEKTGSLGPRTMSTMLGVPLSKPTTRVSSDMSWVGGAPLALEPLPALSPCPQCSLELTFVCQVFAPVEVPRALHVFACLRAGCCSLRSWVVVRSQQQQGTHALPHEQTLAASQKPATSSSAAKHVTAWTASSAQAVTVDDLESMLAALEAGEEEEAEKPPASAPKPAALPAPSPKPAKAPLCVELDIIHEPDHSVAAPSSRHVDELLARYRENDSDNEESDGQAHGVGLEEAAARTTGHGAKASRVAAKRKGNSSRGDQFEKEKDEKLPPALKHLIQFQERISLAPSQCVRYDYGGDPCLPVVVSAGTLRPPPCESCGAPRAFELQLVPQVLVVLDRVLSQGEVDASCTSDHDGTRAVAALDSDFSSVLVYSCSASCTTGRMEHCVALPGL